MRAFALLIFGLLAASALSGCVGGAKDTPNTTPAGGTEAVKPASDTGSRASPRVSCA